MATEQDRKKFAAEFEALKAKYGEEFTNLKVVRFYDKKALDREFTPIGAARTTKASLIARMKDRSSDAGF
jgi:hypothetical protein